MKKKLMILLIAALFVAMIFSTGCKKSWDITGSWTINYFWSASSSNSASSPSLTKALASSAGTGTIIFTGDKKSGTFLADGYLTGTYTVNDKSATWIFAGNAATYTGTSTDDNTMSGTMYNTSGGNGTWNASR